MSAILSGLGADAAEGEGALQRAAIPTLLAILALAAGWVILAHPQEPVWDQQALLQARFSAPHLPSPAEGFTSQLIVASASAILPESAAAQNAGVRVIAMGLYLASAALLASTVLRRRALVAVFLAFVFSSQFPFLWLSSELFTATFLMLAISAWARGSPPWRVGATLALLGLCKPDVIAVAVALLAYWVHRRSSAREAWTLVGSFAATLVVLLLPGTLVHGLAYFQSYGGSGGRSFASFGQHYAALIAHFQLVGPPPNPWTETATYVQRHFPGAENMGDVVFGHFPQYLEFVALSSVRGLFRAGYLAHYAVLAVPCLAWGWHRTRFVIGDRERTLLLSFVGVAPFVLFAFPHVRYLARYYPIFLLLLLIALEHLLAREDRLARPAVVTAGACLVVALFENLGRLASGLAQISEVGTYWFPD